MGPTAQDQRWQVREQQSYALTDFSIDWEHEQARCPQGQTSSSWTPTRTRNQEVIKIKFGYATCEACPVRAESTQSRQRTLTVRRPEAYFALEAARQRERTEEFAELYAGRAGIEDVHAEARPPDGIAPIALYWRAAHPSATGSDRSCHQFVPIAWLVNRRFPTFHSTFAF